MDQTPLVIEQKDAGRRFLTEFDKVYPLKAAFWLQESDSESWDLYVVSDHITDDNFDLGYGEVVRITDDRPDPWLDPFHVKLVGANDPTALAVAQILRKYPGSLATNFHGRMLGGVSVEGVYVYENPLLATAP